MMTDPDGRLAFLPADDLSLFVGIEDTCVYPRADDDFPALDEHSLTGHDDHWEQDLSRIVDLGVTGARYGMSWPTVHVARGRFDWSRLDPVVERFETLGLHLMADLVHYGCPIWLPGSFVDEDFVAALTEFTAAILERYGAAIGSVTPVNEPLTTASFCGARKVWPPALGSEQGWAAVTVSVADAVQSVTRVIREMTPSMPIVHVEAAHLFEAVDPALRSKARELDRLGDLATDLVVGRVGPGSWGWAWLSARGVSDDVLRRLQSRGVTPDVIGVNYYPDLTPRVLTTVDGAELQMTIDRGAAGLSRAIRHAAERYGLPVLVTETSIEGSPERRARWVEDSMEEVRALRVSGIDVRGLTWWPLLDFIDWSYLADGESVEEFVGSEVDPDSLELVPVPIPTRDRSSGVGAFARRMGLLHLEDDLARTSTAAFDAFAAETLRGSSTAGTETSSAGALLRRRQERLLTEGWTASIGPSRTMRPVQVPGLWEAQGAVDLDGTVQYRLKFAADALLERNHATLRFDAVMDAAEVTLNGVEVASHDLPYSPFEVDVSGLLRETNDLLVRVHDHPTGSPEHLASAHGKQGWANHEFPSPPSLYLAYGGIWQPVRIRSHGVVAIRDVWSDLDPGSTGVSVELENLGSSETTVTLDVDIGGCRTARTVRLAPRSGTTLDVTLDTRVLQRWRPADPVLHTVTVSADVCGEESDWAAMELGLRRLELSDDGLITIDGETQPMRSALVQGFHPDALYAEGPDDHIEREILAAQQLGFTMLRLHLRAFDPRYIEACDRLGMLLHCDMPIAEPLAHDEVDGVGPLFRGCVDAVRAQVRRDRSHPSIVLWSAMNEVGIDRPSLRITDRYENFVRGVLQQFEDLDPNRPVIENDWIDPDPSRVFTAELATAHWYGHLDSAYLAQLEARLTLLADEQLPVAVTELGDWGLPPVDAATGKFYDHVASYKRMLKDTWWPRGLVEFALGTQRYQGQSDRHQIERLRTSAAAGYCLTELTDVPWEFNGLLDIRGRVKPGNEAEIRAANAAVAPILVLQEHACSTAHPIAGAAWIVNDTDQRIEGDVTVTLGTETQRLGFAAVEPLSRKRIGCVALDPPATPGESQIGITLQSRSRTWQSRYPVFIGTEVQALDHIAAVDDVAARLGAPRIPRAERSAVWLAASRLDDQTMREAREHLRSGGALVLVDPGGELIDQWSLGKTTTIAAEWGGTPFRYTTERGLGATMPPSTVLGLHDAGIAAPRVLEPPDPGAWDVSVAVFKPPPRPANGLVVGHRRIGQGLLGVCTYDLLAPTAGPASRVVILDAIVARTRALHEPAPASGG
jgi:beta-glucosidase